MPQITYLGDAEGQFTWATGRKLRMLKPDEHGGTIRLGTLAGGMKTGKTSVLIAAELDDGSVVMLETSLRLFAAVVVGLIGKHRDELIAEDILAPSPVDVGADGVAHVRYGACACGTWHQPKGR